MNEVELSWQRIENWLRDNAPETYATLNPPAADADIVAAEQVIGVPFPPDVVASLRIHDGVVPGPAAFHVAGRYSPSSLGRITGAWQLLTEILLEQFDEDDMSGHWWHPRWVPIAEDNAGCELIVDGRAGEDNDRVAVRDKSDGAWWDSKGYNWPSWGALLAETADLLYGAKADDRHVPTVISRRLRWTWREQIAEHPASLLAIASPVPEPRPVRNSPEWILDIGHCCLTFTRASVAELIAAFGGDPNDETDAPHGYLPMIRVGTVDGWAFAFEPDRHASVSDVTLRRLDGVSIAVCWDEIELATARERFTTRDPDAVPDGLRALLTEVGVLPVDPERTVEQDILAALAVAIRLGPGEFDPGLLTGPLRAVPVLPLLPEPAHEPRRVHVEFDPDLIATIESATEPQLRASVANALRHAINATELGGRPEFDAALDAAIAAPTGPVDNFSPLGVLLRTQHAEANAAFRDRTVPGPDRRAWRLRSELARVVDEFVARPAAVSAYSLATFGDQVSQRDRLLAALAEVDVPTDTVDRLAHEYQTRRAPSQALPLRRRQPT